MEILDIGTWEVLFIIVIAFLVIGPYKAEEVSKTLGRWLNRLFKSEAWGYIRKASTDMVNWPSKIAREAGMEELEKELQADPSLLNAAPMVISSRSKGQDEENSILPRSLAYSPDLPPRMDEAKKKKSPARKKAAKPGVKNKAAGRANPKGGKKRNA